MNGVLANAARLAALLAAVAPAVLQAQALARGCPKAVDVTHENLPGLWRAQFEGLPQGATLLLERHPEYKGVRGAINRNGERARLSGEMERGEFLLEESVNGTDISATWEGTVAEGSCGREVRGTWRLESDKVLRPFVLRKQ